MHYPDLIALIAHFLLLFCVYSSINKIICKWETHVVIYPLRHWWLCIWKIPITTFTTLNNFSISLLIRNWTNFTHFIDYRLVIMLSMVLFEVLIAVFMPRHFKKCGVLCNTLYSKKYVRVSVRPYVCLSVCTSIRLYSISASFSLSAGSIF